MFVCPSNSPLRSHRLLHCSVGVSRCAHMGPAHDAVRSGCNNPRRIIRNLVRRPGDFTAYMGFRSRVCWLLITVLLAADTIECCHSPRCHGYYAELSGAVSPPSKWPSTAVAYSHEILQSVTWFCYHWLDGASLHDDKMAPATNEFVILSHS